MQKSAARLFGILIALLALGGFFVNEGYLLGLMNADLALDWLRLILAVILLYVGFGSNNANLIQGSLILVGILYVGIGLLGMFDAKLWGSLPNGLTGFDIGFHLIAGAAALGVAFVKGPRQTITST